MEFGARDPRNVAVRTPTSKKQLRIFGKENEGVYEVICSASIVYCGANRRNSNQPQYTKPDHNGASDHPMDSTPTTTTSIVTPLTARHFYFPCFAIHKAKVSGACLKLSIGKIPIDFSKYFKSSFLDFIKVT